VKVADTMVEALRVIVLLLNLCAVKLPVLLSSLEALTAPEPVVLVSFVMV
jgi:hypothetical protein